MESGKKLYLECYSGISGDMTVAALLDLGADEKVLLEALESLPVSGFRVEIKRVVKSGIDACDFRVILDKEHENHDHDMEYLHGHEDGHMHHGHQEHEACGEHVHSHIHEEGNGHHHDHTHGESGGHHHDHAHGESGGHHHDHAHGESDGHHHSHVHGESDSHHHDHIHEESRHHEHSHVHEHSHHHHHEHRGMREIRQIINQGSMADGAKKLALKIFEILAQAEAKAHNMAIDEVHFHEVGAVDSIVDIVAAAVCLDNLDIHEVIVPMLCEGTGTVRCQHGILPIPVPAVANIMRSHKLPVRIVDAEGEFVTPTGAAIVAAVRTSETLPKEFAVEKVGIGAGKRNYERPGILRAMVIQDRADDQDVIWKLESNIDD